MRKVFGIIIVIAVSAIAIIIIFNLFSTSGEYQKSCNTDADCTRGTCKFDPDYNKKICTSGKVCSTISTNLLECDPSGANNDCNVCINEPAYACVVVDDLHPYKVKEGTKVVSLPNSKPGKGWCLLPFKPSVKCSSLTSDTILTESIDAKGDVVYEWTCLCKFPNLVTKTTGGDCNIEVACGAHENIGSLFVPDGGTVACTGNSDCVKDEICHAGMCYKNWATDKDVDPTKGICKCPANMKYIGTDQNKLCVSDGCAPNGKSDGNVGCICNKPAGGQGYLACPGEVLNPTMKNQCRDSATCLPDPCYPGGTASMTDGCVCKDGYIREFTPGSATQWVCKKACEPSVCGSRGNCVVVGTGRDKKETCTGCNCPYTNVGDDSNMCGGFNGKLPNGNTCEGDKQCCNGDCSFHIFNYVCK
jgi:hypothetical protein